MRVALLTVALAVLAGCATPSATVEVPPAVGMPSLATVGCSQTHTFAAYPVEAFDGMLPEGWRLQPADPYGRTTQIYLAGSLCESAIATVDGQARDLGPLGEVWGYLFVIPPEGADDAYDGELWPLGGIVDGADALGIYHAWGLGEVAVEGEVALSLAAPVPGSTLSQTSATGASEAFEVDASARSASTPFHAGAFRVWIPADDEDGIAGASVYAWPEGGTDLGLGPGSLRYDGPLLNAPPIGPALVHHVRDVSANATRLA